MPSKPKASPKRISPREAAQHAQDYLLAVVDLVENVKIQEIELDDQEQFWFITLSYYAHAAFGLIQREYKIFKVDAYTGEVKSMKIRQV